jgi:cyclopropane fatty-acyl-phospholipid synthase-like methyltransferase
VDLPLEDLVARLERERQHADRLYNDALTAVDRAIHAANPLPPAPRPYDDAIMPAVNRSWNILPTGAPTFDRSLGGRLRAFVWRLVGPPLETQKQFNAAVVDHLNRNQQAALELPRAVGTLVEEARRQFEALARFESLLVQYLQTITAYVDSKDRSIGGSELRERLALAEQRLQALKRDVENLGGHRSRSDAPIAAQQTTTVDEASYVGFEDRFRGTQRDIRGRVEDYLPILSGTTDVLDVGCGRGELLGLLKDRGVTARGIDANAAMVEICQARGLDVECADAVSYLQRQPDSSIGAVVAVQVVEHFEATYLLRFLETAHRTMRPGAPLLLETINASCWMAFFETYIRDLTHRHPLHPDTLHYLVQAAGFRDVNVQFRQPVDERDRLERAPASPDSSLAAVVAAINAHADRLNSRLFSSMDYAVIARRST